MADHTYKTSDAEEADAEAVVGDVDAWFQAQAATLFAQCSAIRQQRRLAAAGVASTSNLTAAEIEAVCAPREAKKAAEVAAEAEATAAAKAAEPTPP